MYAYEATLRIENHLSFRTYEYGNTVITSRVLHNWALRFALNGIRGDPEKDHLENLSGKPIYATPAIPLDVDYVFTTFHPFPEAPYLLTNPNRLTPGSVKSYQTRFTILHYKEEVQVGSRFRFAIASTEPLRKEMVITYGGKQTLQRVFLEPAEITDPIDIKNAIRHPINPLDFPEDIYLKNIFQYTLPPSPLYVGNVVGSFKGRIIRKNAKQYVIPPSW